MTVHTLPVRAAERPRPDYSRPRLAWIKRRARRLERMYGITRRLAIYDAWRDYIDFTSPGQRPRLVVLPGGRA